MSMNSIFAKAAVLAAFGSVAMGAAAICTGPADLQAKVQTHPDAQSYADLGSWFGKQHRYACATEAFRSAIKLNPKSADLNYLLGLSLDSSGHAEDAIGPLEESIRLAPNTLKPHLVLATAFNELKRDKDAEMEWRTALKIDPKSLIVIDGLSKSLIAEQEYAAAIGLLQSAPTNESLTLDLVLAYGKAGKLDDAGQVVLRALKKNPSSVKLMNALATVLVQQNRYQDAVQLGLQAVKMHPHNLDAERLYLRVLVLNHDSASARPLGRRLLAQAPHDFDFLYLNGILEREAGEYDKARDHLEQAVVLNPDNYDCRYNLGVVLAQLNQPAEAKEQFEKALALGATQPQVRYEFANVLRTLGETDRAQEQLKIYQQEMQASVRQSLAQGKAAQAEEALAKGDSQQAVALYREAVEATPQDAVLLYKLGLAIDQTGDTAAERTVLEQAVKIDPTLALAQNQLGYLSSRSGDSAAAEEHFRMAVSAAPGYTEAWVSLAATLGMESRFQEAQKAVETALQLDPHNENALHLRQELMASQGQQ